MEIARHKTAISRTDLSRPVKRAISDGILRDDQRLFDYGCGRGDDLRMLGALGFEVAGWDPIHRPDTMRAPAPIVNLGFVVNVIEDSREREAALRAAWELTEQVLIVAARLHMDSRFQAETSKFEDGCLTSRGTFQKLYDQQELRSWIDQSLEVSSVAAGPGIFYIFRSEEDRAGYLASRYRRRLSAPRLSRSAQLFDEHRALLEPLIQFFEERGRLPLEDEIDEADALLSVFGSAKRAFAVVRRASDEAAWDEIASARTQDLLIYLALSRFDGRPAFGRLPGVLQRDVKAFFSAYTKACEQADSLLYAIGAPGAVDQACQDSEIGKLTPSALYVHAEALDSLSPTLRLFEGCARGYIGQVDGANLVKLHRGEPKVSYLSYPEFECDPHPALAFAVTVHLQTFRVKSRRYTDSQNPPILHRKETFLTPDHPLYAKFARLTRIEESKGLYEDTSRIGARDGWNEVLSAKGLTFKGHRLLKAP